MANRENPEGTISRPFAWLAVTLICLALLLTTISQYQVLLFSADYFNALHYFYFKAQLSDSFVELFDKAAQLSNDIKDGPTYLRMVIVSHFPLNYPPLLLSANWLRTHFQSVPIMESLAIAMSMGALAATIPSLILFASFVLALPRPSLPPILAVLAVIALLPLFPGRPPLALPEPLLHPALRGSMRGEPIIILAILGFIAWAATTARLEACRARCARLIGERIDQLSNWLLIASVLAVLTRLAMPPTIGLELIDLALSVMCAIVIGNVLRLPPLITVAVAFTAYSALYVQYFAFQATTPTPKGAAALVATGVLIYTSRKPTGKLTWLMPSILFLHVTAGGLFALSVAIAEIVICLRRRKLSPLLISALLTFIASRAIGMALFAGLGEGVALAPALNALFSSSHALIIAALRLLPFVLVVVCLIRLRDERFDATLRAALLLLQLSALTSLSSILLNSPLDPFDPSVFVLTQAYSYLGAMLGFGIPLMIMSDLLGQKDRADAVHPQRSRWFGFDTKGSVIVAGFVFLLCFKGDYYIKYPDGVLRALERGLFILVDPAGARPTDPTIAGLSFDDDRYLLRTTKWWRPSDPLTYASVLKMLLRIEAGSFDKNRARIEVLDEEEAPNWGASPTFAKHVWIDH